MLSLLFKHNRVHNVDIQTILNGKVAHSAMKTSIDDNRKVIVIYLSQYFFFHNIIRICFQILTMKNLTNEAYRFNMRCMSPMVIPFNYALLYMIQSGEYIFAPEFIASYKKLHMDEAAALWQMIHFPTSTTMHQLQVLIFDSRTFGPDIRLRYCDNRFCFPQSDVPSSHRASSTTTLYEDSVNKAQDLIQLCRSKFRISSNPQHLQDDFINLPQMEVDDNLYTLDITGSLDEQLSHDNNICPSHLHEMLSIVAKVRNSRDQNTQNLLLHHHSHTFHATNENTTMEQEVHLSTSSQRPTRMNLLSPCKRSNSQSYMHRSQISCNNGTSAIRPTVTNATYDSDSDSS